MFRWCMRVNFPTFRYLCVILALFLENMRKYVPIHIRVVLTLAQLECGNTLIMCIDLYGKHIVLLQ